MLNPVKRVAAIHDLSGFGRAALTVVIPILSSMGIQVCPLPTAILSAHGKFKGHFFADLTTEMKAIIEHWKTLSISFDAIYSGFLGSVEQIEIVSNFITTFRKPQQIVVVDPVLGDNGKVYKSLDAKMVEQMRELIKFADVITPNLTEAALLLNKSYSEDISEAEVREWILELQSFGPKIVIVTSVPEKQHSRKTAVIAYDAVSKRFWKVSCDYLPADYPGTGDAFTSVITGSLLQGDSLPIAMDRAMQFTTLGVRATFGYEYDTKEGILLERILSSLHTSVQLSTYEILD